MKKWLCFLLIAALLVPLYGCAILTEETQVPVEFYYLRQEFAYGTSDGVITCETRESAGHVGDVKYLLTLYLQGPLDEALISPFPVGCRILEIGREGSKMTVTFNASFTILKDMDLTLACVCMARTCLSMVDVQTVQIQAKDASGEIIVAQIINSDSLLLEDTDMIPTETTN